MNVARDLAYIAVVEVLVHNLSELFLLLYCLFAIVVNEEWHEDLGVEFYKPLNKFAVLERLGAVVLLVSLKRLVVLLVVRVYEGLVVRSD